MTSLLQFEEKVHRKDLARAESIPLLGVSSPRHGTPLSGTGQVQEDDAP